MTPAFTATAARKIRDLVSRGFYEEETLGLFKQLHDSGIHGDPSYLPSVLKACSSPRSLPLALQLHCTILKTGHVSDPVTANSLLSVYSRHSHVRSARQLFDAAPFRDTVSWNSMATCYVRNGYLEESVELFEEMHDSGLLQKPELAAMVLSVCGRMGNLRLGRKIHARAVCVGRLETCVILSTALVDMYSRCHDFFAASRVFDLMLERNEVSWTAMITGCAVNGRYDASLEVFKAMMAEGIQPNRATLITVLPACGKSRALNRGKEIHGYVLRRGFESEPQVAGALIDMYGRCKGAERLAWHVFDRTEERDVVTWSLMIGNYSRNGDIVGAMELFRSMQTEGVKPNAVTMLAVAAACVGSSSVECGLGIHGYILKSGLFLDVSVGNSLINMYAKYGCLDSSVRVFTQMPIRDSVSWSCVISSYGVHGRGYDALKLFNEMQEMGIEPDEITLLAVLSACDHSGLVDEGKELFDRVIKDRNFVLSIEHYACYVDLLGRCGRLEDACDVVRTMPVKPNPRIWTSLVSACRVHGRYREAEQLARWLVELEPENAANYTLLSVIYAESGNWVGTEEVRRTMTERGVKKISGCSQIETGKLNEDPYCKFML